MSDWGGFTDDDLRRMKQNVKQNNDLPQHRPTSRVANKKARPKGHFRSHGDQGTPNDSISNEQMLCSEKKDSTPLQVQSRRPAVQLQKQTVTKAATENAQGTGTGHVELRHPPKPKTQETSEEVDNIEERKEKTITDDKEIMHLEMSNLDKFRVQQKQIEELNKKKRQLLASAIVERQKKARAESVKLMRIQRELEKLDQMLTVDVSLIRDRIEDTSRTYMDAQKRFDKAEKEYIAAKMGLFDSQEKKEQLTEHLYTVIHQNEIRKAKKLKELMEKLEMESEGDNSDVSELIKSMTMPSLTVLNAMPTHKIISPVSPPPHTNIAPSDQSHPLATPSDTKIDNAVSPPTDQSQSLAQGDTQSVVGNSEQSLLTKQNDKSSVETNSDVSFNRLESNPEKCEQSVVKPDHENENCDTKVIPLNKQIEPDLPTGGTLVSSTNSTEQTLVTSNIANSTISSGKDSAICEKESAS